MTARSCPEDSAFHEQGNISLAKDVRRRSLHHSVQSEAQCRRARGRDRGYLAIEDLANALNELAGGVGLLQEVGAEPKSVIVGCLSVP